MFSGMSVAWSTTTRFKTLAQDRAREPPLEADGPPPEQMVRRAQPQHAEGRVPLWLSSRARLVISSGLGNGVSRPRRCSPTSSP